MRKLIHYVGQVRFSDIFFGVLVFHFFVLSVLFGVDPDFPFVWLERALAFE